MLLLKKFLLASCFIILFILIPALGGCAAQGRAARSEIEDRFLTYMPEKYRSTPVDQVPLPVLQEAHTRYVANEARVALALGNDRVARAMTLDEYISVVRAISGTGVAAADGMTGVASVVLTARGQFRDVYRGRFGSHEDEHSAGRVPFSLDSASSHGHPEEGESAVRKQPFTASTERPLYHWLRKQQLEVAAPPSQDPHPH